MSKNCECLAGKGGVGEWGCAEVGEEGVSLESNLQKNINFDSGGHRRKQGWRWVSCRALPLGGGRWYQQPLGGC